MSTNDESSIISFMWTCLTTTAFSPYWIPVLLFAFYYMKEGPIFRPHIQRRVTASLRPPTLMFFLPSLVTFVLSLRSLVLYSRAQSRLEHLAGYRKVGHEWTSDDGIALTAVGTIKIEYRDDASFAMFLGAGFGLGCALLETIIWITYRSGAAGRAKQSVLLVLAYASAALHHFLIALWTTTTLFRLEYNAPPGGTCYRSHEQYRGNYIQVTKCTEESAACLALPLHAVWRNDILVPACEEARTARWCLFANFLCSTITLVVFLYRLTRRKTSGEFESNQASLMEPVPDVVYTEKPPLPTERGATHICTDDA